MDVHAKQESYGQSVLRRFESHGFWIGLGLGLRMGVFVSGPNFHDWAARLEHIRHTVVTSPV